MKSADGRQFMSVVPNPDLAEAAGSERSYLGDASIVAVDVHHAETMMNGRFGDQQIGNRCAVPHSVMMSQITLQHKRPFQQGWRSRDGRKASAQLGLQLIVVSCRAGGVELFQLANRADKELAGEFSELGADDGIGAAGGGALVEDPACYRHIASDASTSTSTCEARRSRY